MPPPNAVTKISAKGANKKTVRNSTETPISSARTAGPSAVAGAEIRAGAATALTTGHRLLSTAPTLQRVDRQQHHERDQQHHDGNRGCAGVVVLFQFGHDKQWRDLRAHRHIAGDEDDRAVLSDAARKGQRKTRDRRGKDRGIYDAQEGLPAARA